ncbi:MAG: aminotransferase class I/II-fold pyridoxal phosphate-dependent enzyme [Candidatus Omnitrophica bacterium]|nr:aminotransferase class I/II-fold pyridoxal phosphate-dependent enzyme [Candidatus Omnitrophota bacterium]
MDFKLSKKVEELAPSGIRAFFDLVLGMKDVISLGVGEPDFVTPWNIREKAIYSLEQGYTSYTSNKGMVELRKHISVFLKKRHGIEYDPEEEILITVGVSEALDLAMRAIINPKDKVIIPDPSYVAYAADVDLAYGIPVRVATDIKHGFKLNPRVIDDAAKKGAKALLLNYPSNPTGASYSRKELEEIAKVIKKREMIIITDEVYDELTYDFEHTAFPRLKGMKEHVIYLNGFSKAYAMTGFRVGYACGPRKAISAMTKIHQYTMLCVPITAQMAASEALKNGFKSVQEMKREYKRRREYIVGALNEMGLPCHTPEGAFYVFPSIESTKESSGEFAKNLLLSQKVAVVPGTAFGKDYDGYVRIAYASSYDNLKEAAARIKKYLEKK